jgi:Pyruvate/2-oxoacid:ferredoxin oxidoreductase delta subunit
MLRMYYFSGTGNARNVARWMGEAWRERGQEAEVIDIAGIDVDRIIVGRGDDVGLASPTHGFNFPPVTLAFLFAFPRTAWGNRVCILNTRGGVRLFGVYVPGLSGVAQLLAALVFLLKGYRVVGMRPVDLPSSWISLHPGLRDDTIRAIYERCEAATRQCANRLIGGRRDLRALFDLPQDLLIAPISLGYYLVGRFFFAKSFIASAACDACGACVTQCPLHAVRLVAGRPFWSHRCESCMRCMNHCPKRAIETAHGFVAGFLVAFNVALTALVYPLLLPLFPVLSGASVAGTMTRFAFESALMLAVLFLSYRLLHIGLRFRPIERLAVLTSLTHFAFWRRYRAPHRGPFTP